MLSLAVPRFLASLMVQTTSSLEFMGILHLWFLFNQVYFLFLYVFFNYTPCNVMPNMVIMFMKIFALIPRVYCVKSVQIRSYFWSIFSCIQFKYRKIRTRNNTVFGRFSHSVLLRLKTWNYYFGIVISGYSFESV